MNKWLRSTLLFVLFIAGTLLAQTYSRDYITQYEAIDLDFLRSHYTEINNGRAIAINGSFSSYHWLSPYEYKSRLKLIGFDVQNYNVLQMVIKEKDDFHYSFPILLFHTASGDLQELDKLFKGVHVSLYGRFYKLKNSEYAIEVDVLEVNKVSTHVNLVGTPVFKMGGHEQILLLDGRISPSPTPTSTVTPTPQPNLWQKVNNMINPKETITPTGTITPGT